MKYKVIFEEDYLKSEFEFGTGVEAVNFAELAAESHIKRKEDSIVKISIEMIESEDEQ